MSAYAPPLREMLFAMKELGGLDAMLAQPGNEEVTGAKRITTHCTYCRKPARCATQWCMARPPRWA